MFHLFAEPREIFHIPLPALDFLVENHPIESFPALDQLLSEIQVGLRDKTEAIDVLQHHVFGFLDALGYFDFLFAGQERHLAHLLEIHPHWVVQDIDLGFGSLFLFQILLCVFFAVLVTIDFRRFDNVDLQPTQPREDKVQFIGVSDSLGQRLV